MRLIDSEKLADRIENYWEWEVLPPTLTKILRATISDIRYAEEVKAIPIDWMLKELSEMIYERVSSGEINKVFYELIGRWEKQNESRNSN